MARSDARAARAPGRGPALPHAERGREGARREPARRRPGNGPAGTGRDVETASRRARQRARHQTACERAMYRAAAISSRKGVPRRRAGQGTFAVAAHCVGAAAALKRRLAQRTWAILVWGSTINSLANAIMARTAILAVAEPQDQDSCGTVSEYRRRRSPH